MAAALPVPQRTYEVVEATPIGECAGVGDHVVTTFRTAAQHKRFE
jgi:hypothetical protein